MQPLRRETGKHDYRAELFELIRTRSFGRGRILLASGRESDYYIDMRPTTVHPAGATCVVHPGGSMRDAEVIAAADEHGMAMVLTGVRHFRH